MGEHRDRTRRRGRLAARLAPAWLGRLVDDLRLYVDGVRWERSLRAAAITPYADALSRWIRGNLDWHGESARDRGTEDLSDAYLLAVAVH